MRHAEDYRLNTGDLKRCLHALSWALQTEKTTYIIFEGVLEKQGPILSKESQLRDKVS
jgi:hypothetical protein